MSQSAGEQRVEREYRRELLGSLKGIQEALEKLASDPEIEVEAGPAFCPHCGTMNPEVTIFPTEGAGRLLEFVLVAECHHCNHTFHGIVESWSMFTSAAALQADLSERVGADNGN